jgi:rSAM/selenodomain-associated transferase 1
MTNKALIIFAKNPEVGKVKTRLAATIGNEVALAIYHQLLLHTVSITQDLSFHKFVFYSNLIEQEDMWNSQDYRKQAQNGIDLGARMKNAFASIFLKTYNSAVIIGTDCPGLNATIITNAFTYLQSHDVVIGPAEDGGYYLLGMNELHSKLFEDIEWSTSAVLSDTIKRCEDLHLNYYLLPVLNDIDEERDLQAFKLQKQ